MTSIERFHCIEDSQLGPNGVLYREKYYTILNELLPVICLSSHGHKRGEIHIAKLLAGHQCSVFIKGSVANRSPSIKVEHFKPSIITVFTKQESNGTNGVGAFILCVGSMYDYVTGLHLDCHLSISRLTSTSWENMITIALSHSTLHYHTLLSSTIPLHSHMHPLYIIRIIPHTNYLILSITPQTWTLSLTLFALVILHPPSTDHFKHPQLSSHPFTHCS